MSKTALKFNVNAKRERITATIWLVSFSEVISDCYNVFSKIVLTLFVCTQTEFQLHALISNAIRHCMEMIFNK